MRVAIRPGGTVSGETGVPGDKSIAHRWLILAALADGPSMLRGLPASLDVLATARCLALLAPRGRPSLEGWASKAAAGGQAHGFTWDDTSHMRTESPLLIEAEGRDGLAAPVGPLDCANSGTTMRLLAGVVAAAPFATVLTGDEILRARPMERVADPLREMGAIVRTSDGHPPIEVSGRELHGVNHLVSLPSAQVKGCVLLAGLAATGTTTVEEPVATRDHTERALRELGAPIEIAPGRVTVSAFRHAGYEGTLPGDVSSAAFLAAAAGLTGSDLVIRGVGLNPTRTRFLDVMRRMGIATETRIREERLGEPVGDLAIRASAGIAGTEVPAAELPLVIDEVPALAALAAHAAGETWFAGAGELRVKESDRLTGLAEGIRALGGDAGVEGDDLVVAGGGLAGGSADARGDHRMAMALLVASLAARAECAIDGMESADVSFPGFLPTLARLGARVKG